MSRSIIVKSMLLLGVFLALGLLANAFELDAFFKSYGFRLNSPGLMSGPIGFVILSTGLISISCPRQIISFFAAFFFGLWIGVGLALIAMTLSCIITYFLGTVFQKRLVEMVRGKVKIGVQFWQENAFLATVIWRFIPAGSNLLTNLAAGALGISNWRFIVGSAIGYIPHTIVFALLGSGLEIESGPRIAVSIVLFAVALGLGWWLYRRFSRSLMADKKLSHN